MTEFVSIYTAHEQARNWLDRYRGKQPLFACILGFTATGLIPGISAAGATPDDRKFTAIADAEFLINGVQPRPSYPLPPLHVGASPTYLSRAVVESLQIPVKIFNSGLPIPPSIDAIDLKGTPANCLSTGQALSIATVQHLFNQGLLWGETLAQSLRDRYLIIGECVVGGTTTALAILTGLGFDAHTKVNSSHAICNHAQKWQLVQSGLSSLIPHPSSLSLVSALGDPMQIVAAGMTIAASRFCGVLLAGGTQMLAVYALARSLSVEWSLDWHPENIVIGTTRWVAEDPTGDTIGLAHLIDSAPLLATRLNFARSRYPQLQAYEQGFVKEGVGSGGCAIAAHLFQNWGQSELLGAIEHLLDQTIHASPNSQNPP